MSSRAKAINILLLSAGRRVELISCFKAARDRLGIRGKVIGADVSAAAPAPYFADEACLVPRVTDAGYIDELVRLCKDKAISLVVPTIDTELEILAENKSRIERESGAIVMISNAQSVAACCNKHKTAAFLKERGFDFPRVVTKEEIASGKVKFPLFIKPENGSSSKDAFKVTSFKQLDAFCEFIHCPIVQEFVEGTEYTVDCFCDFDGNVISVVPRIRLATRGGEIMRGKIDGNERVSAVAKRLVKEFGFIGQTTVQCFLCEDGAVKIIEINPRFGGGAPMSIYAGADSCEWLYRLLSGEKLEYRDDYEDGAMFSRYDRSVRVHE
ncbi:MAG: ATP-grasp domain-containing protein [Roseburia sp.]|nr:ATP-grasp domain-containing protein [Roseburia sp.]